MDSDCPFGIFKLFLYTRFYKKNKKQPHLPDCVYKMYVPAHLHISVVTHVLALL